MRPGRLLTNFVLLSATIGLVGSCGACGYAALRLASIAAHAASRPRVPPAPRPGATIVLYGDLGFEPEPAGLGRGGPPAHVRPPLPPWYWHRVGRRR